MKRSLIVFLFLLTSSGIVAQGSDFMVVYKPGKTKRYYYFVGDMIIVKPVLEFPVQRGIIYGFSDSAVYFSASDSLLFSDFEEVIVKENVKPFSTRLWLNSFLVTTGSIAIWQVAWLVNSGTLSPDLKAAPGIIAFATLSPVLVNQVSRMLVKGKRKIAPGEWQVGVVMMPKPIAETDE